MSAGSGEGRRSIDATQDSPCAAGATSATVVEPVTLGSEQLLQEWQFGAH